jgi:hypothetical protein
MAKTYFSQVNGSHEALIRTQESSARYFQRPDNDYAKLDSNRSSLSGFGGTLGIGKFANGHLRYSANLSWKSPGLELNDIGFISTTDQINQSFWIGYFLWDPFSIFREMDMGLSQWAVFDFGGDLNYKGLNFNFNTQFRNYWSLNSGTNLSINGLSNNALRGGPSMLTPSNIVTYLRIESDERKKFTYEINTDQSWAGENSSRDQDYGVELSYRPFDALSTSLDCNFSLGDRDLQYVKTISLAPEHQYIFGTINQNTLVFSLRLNLSITPTLTLQYWGQPFISAGKYSEFKKIIDPHAEKFADRFRTYSPDEIALDETTLMYNVTDEDGLNYSFYNPDFNFKEFKSNLVARWEFVPGSVIYIVWSQGRSGYKPDGIFDIGQDVSDMFKIHPHDVFLIKISYRFGL